MSLLVSGLSFAAWVLIEVMAYLNLTNTIPMTGGGITHSAFLVFSAAASFMVPHAVMQRKKTFNFFVYFALGLGFQILLASIAGMTIHRDFHCFPAQIIIIYLTILVFRIDSLGVIKNRKAVFKVVTICGIAVFIMWIVWLILMAYVIVVRLDPRWVESAACNLMNGIIGLVFIASVAMLWNKTRHRLRIKREKIFLDERNLSNLLTPQENSIIMAFLEAPGQSLCCSGLSSHLKSNGTAGGKDEGSKATCGQCLSEQWTASSCPVYRNFKNRINDTKKYLELLQIGTIVPVSENPREIKEHGWQLRFFDDIRFEPPRSERRERFFAHVRQ